MHFFVFFYFFLPSQFFKKICYFLFVKFFLNLDVQQKKVKKKSSQMLIQRPNFLIEQIIVYYANKCINHFLMPSRLF